MTAGPTQADGFGTRVCRLTTGLDGRTGYILEVRQYGLQFEMLQTTTYKFACPTEVYFRSLTLWVFLEARTFQ